MGKTNSIVIVAALAAALFIAAPICAQEAEDGQAGIPEELIEAQRLLEGLPDFEGKSEEEVEKILKAHPEYARKIEAAEKKAREAISRMGSGIDMAKIEAAVKELESIEELQGKDDEEKARVLATKPEVRRRVSSAGRRIAVASGAIPSPEEPDEGAPAASTEAELVPDDIGEVVVLPDGTTTNVIDDVFFGELNWEYGGFKGGEAEFGGVLISGLRMARDGLGFNYVRDLSVWGLAHGDADALACLFVCDNEGRWVGGKFDWISSSRNKRDFKNIYSGYEGWLLRNVPNPCTAAFVIVSKDGKKRSNVISAMWER